MHLAAKTDHEPVIFLLLPAKCWDVRPDFCGTGDGIQGLRLAGQITLALSLTQPKLFWMLYTAAAAELLFLSALLRHGQGLRS